MKRDIYYDQDGNASLIEIPDLPEGLVIEVQVPGTVDSESVDTDAEWKRHQKNLKTGKPVIGKVKADKLKQGNN